MFSATFEIDGRQQSFFADSMIELDGCLGEWHEKVSPITSAVVIVDQSTGDVHEIYDAGDFW